MSLDKIYSKHWCDIKYSFDPMPYRAGYYLHYTNYCVDVRAFSDILLPRFSYRFYLTLVELCSQ